MKKQLLTLLLIFQFIFNVNAQKINITGTVLEAETDEKLEYATIIITPKNNDKVTGGITNVNGDFDIEIKAGLYDVAIEFLSLETKYFLNKNLTKDTNLGAIKLNQSAEALDEIEIIAEKSTVEIRLDKKIYNVGKDMTVKGGTASDVLDNVPSVTVDVEGTISLRGNESVRILINGKPSGMVGGTDALRQLPADAIEKVEVITSPSARYDAEGTAGIINIILRKGKALGFNGTLNFNAANPTGYGISTNLNLRGKKFNFFTSTGFSYSDSPGNAYYENEYLQVSTNPFQIENRIYERERKNFNTRFGVEYLITDKSSLTGTISYRNSDRDNNTGIIVSRQDASQIEQEVSTRNEFEQQDDKRLDFSLNFTKTFGESRDHKLTLDFRHNKSDSDEYATISNEIIFPTPSIGLGEKTINFNKNKRVLLQGDYVLPIGENAQFEAGFRSNMNEQTTDYTLEDEISTGNYVVNNNVSNIFTYNEKVHAIYSQYGNKFEKFSALFGLRMEVSDIDVKVTGTDLDSNKKYTEFFPTLNLAYEFQEGETLTLGYNRRIRRPRGWFTNPFPSRASESNIFQGNPDLNPAYSNGIDLGYLKRWDNLITFNTSLYYNYTTDVFQFVRESTGEFTDSGIPITRATPKNIASDKRFGWEFSISYNPFKWWRLNTNFNFYKSSRDGNNIVPNSENTSWNARLSSKVKLPWKIDWQTNINYRAAQENFQSKTKASTGVNLAFSKDLFKEKATLSLNVSDLFNSRKRISNTFIEDFSRSYSEFQWRQRQIRLNFTYRFNQKKKRTPQRNNGGDFEGGGEGGF